MCLSFVRRPVLPVLPVLSEAEGSEAEGDSPRKIPTMQRPFWRSVVGIISPVRQETDGERAALLASVGERLACLGNAYAVGRCVPADHIVQLISDTTCPNSIP